MGYKSNTKSIFLPNVLSVYSEMVLKWLFRTNYTHNDVTMTYSSMFTRMRNEICSEVDSVACEFIGLLLCLFTSICVGLMNRRVRSAKVRKIR